MAAEPLLIKEFDLEWPLKRVHNNTMGTVELTQIRRVERLGRLKVLRKQVHVGAVILLEACVLSIPPLKHITYLPQKDFYDKWAL
jgi:hypothetical protein